MRRAGAGDAQMITVLALEIDQRDVARPQYGTRPSPAEATESALLGLEFHLGLELHLGLGQPTA